MTREERKLYMRNFRQAMREHTGISAHAYEQLPASVRRALREYVQCKLEPVSAYGGMYGHIRERFGFTWQGERNTRY